MSADTTLKKPAKPRGKPFSGKNDPRNGQSPGRPVRAIAIPDALRTEGDLPDDDDPSITKFQAFIRKVYELAIGGNVEAIKFLADRTDGKVTDKHEIMGPDGKPLNPAADIIILWPHILEKRDESNPPAAS